MIILRQRNFSSIKPIFDPILEKEKKELDKGGYKPLATYAGDRYRFYRGKTGNVIRIDGNTLARKVYKSREDAEGYVPVVLDLSKEDAARLWEERKKRKQKNFSLGYRIRKARSTYRDVLEAQSNPEFAKNYKKDLEDTAKWWDENKAKFDDKNRKIVYPGGHKITYKDDLRYRVAKEEQERLQKQARKDSQKDLKAASRSPKAIAKSEAWKTLTKRYSVLDDIEKSQNAVQDYKLKLNKKIFKNSKIGEIGRNNLEAQRAQMTTGTKNLKIMLGK